MLNWEYLFDLCFSYCRCKVIICEKVAFGMFSSCWAELTGRMRSRCSLEKQRCEKLEASKGDFGTHLLCWPLAL